MNDVQAFAFETVKVRVVTIDGAPWFVAADVCRVLGLAAGNGVAQHLKALDPDQKRVVTRCDYMGIFHGDRSPSHTLLSEGGLYDKVLSAHQVNPRAREFRKWVTDTILPALRKDGAYIMGEEKVAA